MRTARVVAKQTKLVEELRAAGQPTGAAEAHLATFRDWLRSYETDLDLADKECRTLRRRCS
jgi:hypothetical protein